MEKPLSIKREEFCRGLIELVNGSALPPCVALEVLRGITDSVAALARKQYEQDLKAYAEQKEAGDA